VKPLVFTCEPGWESAAAAELSRAFPSANVEVPTDGWIKAEVRWPDDSARPIVSLVTQCLPDSQPIDVSSIAAWVAVVGPRIVEGLREHAGPWRLHVFGVYRPGGEIGRQRATLIERGIVEFLKKKQRRLLRSRTSGNEVFGDGEAIVQVGMATKSYGFLSIAARSVLRRMRGCVSPFCGGIVEIPPDRRAPSRAFAKLLEAEIRIGRRIQAGEVCVDLGSSPGSWAYVALRRGANVVAVDRSPLRADLMRNPSLKFIRGDAFRFQPGSPVDWLLCDVIAFPDRVFELLKRWLERRWCRQFCVTIKFRGTDDFAKLEPIKTWVADSGAEFILRRLTSNKNEVTVAGVMRR
jgi:23S rRNA (cytidine2498-2'-O)-methyltransferase